MRTNEFLELLEALTRAGSDEPAPLSLVDLLLSHEETAAVAEEQANAIRRLAADPDDRTQIRAAQRPVSDAPAAEPPAMRESATESPAAKRQPAERLTQENAIQTAVTVERLVVDRLTAERQAASKPAPSVTAAPAPRTGASESSAGSAVLKTVGMLTGAGPVITGLLKLFGSGEPKEPPALVPYSLPEQMAVEAGLSADRSLVPISYSQSGIARGFQPGPAAVESTPSSAQIQVNVQAMDSRSFLDHSDEIARAVREAMLRSHSLNDVVAEI